MSSSATASPRLSSYVSQNRIDDLEERLADMQRRLGEVSQSSTDWKVPKGWKLVPIEPTDEMEKVVTDILSHFEGDYNVYFDEVQGREIYRAMIAAAPSPPQRTNT